VNDLLKLGVKRGDLLNVKVSMKSIGMVEGGAATVVEAIREAVGPEGTFVSEAFVAAYRLPLSRAHSRIISRNDSPSAYGAFPQAMVNHKDAHRATHPILKFVVIGKRAQELADSYTIDSEPYDLLYRIAMEGAKNIKIGSPDKVFDFGTGHSSIEKLGIKPKYRPSLGVNYLDNDKIRLYKIPWPYICIRGFNNLIPYYHKFGAVIAEGRIGAAPSMITSMRRTLEIEMEQIRIDPRVILCSDPCCTRCRIGWDFSDGNIVSLLYARITRAINSSFN